MNGEALIADTRSRPTRVGPKPVEIWARALASMKVMASDPAQTLLDLIEPVAARDPDRPALIGEAGTLSYGAFLSLAHAWRDWAVGEGIGRGEVTALLMPNCPDYIAIWNGIAATGGVCALLNTAISGEALAHGLRVSKATRVIVDASLAERLRAALRVMPDGVRVVVHGEEAPWPGRVSRMEPRPDPAPLRGDDALLIFTSGTTGLPKAARVTHARILEWSFWFAGLMGAEAQDRLYDCLPLYHSTGGICAVGAMLLAGGSVVIRERFSAGRFWEDVAESGCTIFQYIGEICRYLVNAPTGRDEAWHGLRLACGNGMRPEVWARFEARFAVPQIIEFYASTEGNVSLYNVEGRQGAIGRIPPFLRDRFAVELIRLDEETDEPLRDAQGRCVRCGPDETGEAIGRIDAGGAGERAFDGYTDEAASARKVLTDAFGTSDRWFRTGDLMRRDRAGFFSFVDRVGDTFRWKGENVSTTEVASILGRCPGVAAAVVMGITLPGQEGRAGFALVARGDDFDPARLAAHMASELAPHARPVLVRVCTQIPQTGTFKFRRPSVADLSPEGLLMFDRATGGLVDCGAARLREGLVF